MPRRRRLVPVLALAALGAATAGVRGCPPPAAPGAAPPGVLETDVRARALEYLVFATEERSDSPLNAIAHMERERVDPAYTAPAGSADVGSWSGGFTKIDKLLDTRDFDALYFLNAILGYEGHPYVTPALWARTKQALLGFKYWYTDWTPPVPDPADPARDWDETFYWTENHQILFHTIEYLAGQRWPDECFRILGAPATADCSGPGEMTGAAHRDRARGFIRRWMDERWEAGFVEWHSNVYYQKDATPLLTLVEWAGDEETRRAPRSCSTSSCWTWRSTRTATRSASPRAAPT
jgi:hypothetical protein